MQRKATRQSRGPNAAEKRFHDYQKNKGVCDACNSERPLILHHAEGSTFKNNKQLCGHWFVLGLCQECDDMVTNGSRRELRKHYGPQSEMWTDAIADYQLKGECPASVWMAIVDWGR